MRTIRLLLLLATTLAMSAPAFAQDEPLLRTVFEGDFMVGAALNDAQFTERDAEGAALVRKHFNTITPENTLKWQHVHPRPGVYSFDAQDRFVQFGEDSDMFIVGHTLVWHSQTPRWVFQDDEGNPIGREALIERMRDHIQTVVGRYKGRIHGWDVVNEALNEDGTLRRSPWYNIIGEDYIALAFQFAHEADPDAELYYNDFTLENPSKRDGAVRLVKSLLDQGIRVDAIGSQGHHGMDSPSTELQEQAIQAFGQLGVKVHITELDVYINPRPSWIWGAEVSQRVEAREELNLYPEALPDSVQQALAQRYRELFEVFVRNADVVDRITFWGVSDGDSWLNNWPVRGRTEYPLLFDRQHLPKPAFDAVVETGRGQAQ